jgi:hypothetical protein
VFSLRKPTELPTPNREDPSSPLYPRVLAPLGTPALQFVKEGYTVLKRCRGSVFLPWHIFSLPWHRFLPFIS